MDRVYRRKGTPQFWWAWIIKVNIGESAGLPQALPASLITQQRAVDLQTEAVPANFCPFLRTNITSAHLRMSPCFRPLQVQAHVGGKF